MFRILKNITCLLFINLMAGFWLWLLDLFAVIAIGLNLLPKNEFALVLLLYVYIILIFTLIISRLFILPIAYNKLENSKKYALVVKFVKKLKQSHKLKLLVLVIAFLAYYPPTQINMNFAYFNLKEHLMESIVYGLFGSYLVLFIYWYIDDKIKKSKQVQKDANSRN